MEETEAEEVREQLLELYFHVRAFLNIYDILDEHYVIYTELETDDSFLLKLFCVNPAVISRSIYPEETVLSFFCNDASNPLL